MRTLGVVGLSVVLILVLLYQSYVLTEGFKFGVTTTDSTTTEITTTDCANKSKDACTAPCMWNVYSNPQKCVAQGDKTPEEDRQGATGYLAKCEGRSKETCSGPLCMWNVYSNPQKCVSQSAIVSDEDRQGVTGGLLPTILDVHALNIAEQDSNKASDSSYAPYKPSAADRKQQRAKLLRDIQKIVHNELLNERGTTGSRVRCDDDYEDSCDNSAALQQGCEMEDTCN